MEDLKTPRTSAKRAVTTQINRVRQYIAEVKDALNSAEVKREDQSLKDNPNADLSRKEFLHLLNLPKVELQIFHGNPLHYHQFIRAFEANVDRVCDDNDLKLSRLMQYTSGSAKEAIRSCQLVGGSSGYAKAISILENRFGNSHLVTERLIRELRFGKQVRLPQDIQQLADDMQNAFLVLSELKTLKEVDSQAVLIEIVARFPNYVQLRWKKFALKAKRADGCYPGFKEFIEFAGEIASEVNDPVYGDVYLKRSDKCKREQRILLAAILSLCLSPIRVLVKVPRQQNLECTLGLNLLVYYVNNHTVCGIVISLNNCVPRERLTVVIKHKLCHNCLRASHNTSDCGKRSVCSVRGCGRKHTMYIHCDDNTVNSSPDIEVSNASFSRSKSTHMPLVQATVNSLCDAFVLLDSASSNSFCSRALVNQLGITGNSYQFELRTLNSSGIQQSEMVDLSLSSKSGEILKLSAVYVVDEIPVKNSMVDLECYSHLSGIGPLPAYQSTDITVDILVGQDNSEALVPLEVRRGVQGSSLRECGVGFPSWSYEDKLVISLWDKEHRKVDGHHELPIPWRDRSETLPNNFVVAKTRLDSLYKKLVRNGSYDRYNAEIVKLVDNCYAEAVPDSELFMVDRIWYLPHHAVVSEKKPDKLRVVFDCASNFKGKSLNDRCMQGPDMINKLLPVLLRFRQHSIAVQADIEAMYNQVRIPARDRDALRFLWYINGKLRYLRMTSHLFGGVWCAASSAYALRRTITDLPSVIPLVKYAVERSFYVDDCLSSVSSKSDAEIIIREIPKALKSGGFKLTKFVVNDFRLLAEVSVECRAKEVLDFGTSSESRALDASSKGYGCCCYVRCVNRKGEIHVQLVMSKSKVAPLKLRTIPRLELQAAVLAVKVDSLLRRELALEFAKSYFWTDSEVVLKYIHNDSRRFHVFVGNRVSLIREFSDPQQWFHIETKANPADLVTRNCSFSKFNSSKWFNGPDKLGRYKNDWQTAKLNSLVLTDDDPEVKETDVTVGYTTVAGHVSSWVK
ncbi:hypothetical protein BSL78_23710 [Apostichopus japonicus]|uniref:Reverse transcriptase domain-containing protein n=1 Tax=Stichopus japonicus TaxID=307972 RepID=A0A2G8JUS0_STIJA|nr:hypothetical protein BSL78_23710 [Apostichopus japonicus]